ncbi:hypothetical protein RJ55_07136 [Drechmeria coniospora]|nr:hypothetical protein RJ55_07136 [Drechmeria coniospora]
MKSSALRTPDSISSNYEFLSPIGYANSSSPRFYQTLLDRCWRRSGTLLYRPNQRQACCPHYTIRLDSHQFKPSRDQRQALNRFNKFIIGDSYSHEAAKRYPRTRQEAKRRDNEFCLVDRIHEAEYANLKTPPEPAHRLVVTLEEDSFSEEKYQVYDNYQKVVHHEEPEDRARRCFERFLCNSPVRRETMVTADGRRRRLGSYHQCYRIDGNLVAIGVLDLLPDCVSSVYFLYHESIHKHSPGKLGALHEIALAVEEGYRWWYPGFYIHNCPKMRYKIDYSPQFILDPQSLRWDPLDEVVLRLLDRKRFVSLSLERQTVMDSGTDEPACNESKEDADDAADEDAEGHISLFRSDMPGIPSLSDMERIDLDHVPLKVWSHGPMHETGDLAGWESKGIVDFPSAKATVAELVAAVGTDLIDCLCIDSSSRR